MAGWIRPSRSSPGSWRSGRGPRACRLTGPGGLLGRLTKVVLEGALEGEMDAHLGYAKHDPAGRDGGNSRNGHAGQDGAHRRRPGGDRGAPGPGRQLRADDRGQAAAAAGRGR